MAALPPWRVALLEDDCAVLNRFEGRSSLQAFLSVLIERLFFDRREEAGTTA